MKPSDLDDEYAPKRAAARDAARARRAQRQAERERRAAEPIADATELSRAAARLANAWGLKRKRTKAH